jgi:hypothetical protein
MPSEKMKRIMRETDEASAEFVRRAEETGELRHLYGKPLELDDDPDWLITRVLKQEGHTHPLLDRARDLEEPERLAQQVIERLHRRRARLSRPDARTRPEDVRSFNEARLAALEEYAERLRSLNRAITNYNLALPTALHRLPVRVEEAVSKAAEDVPPLEWTPQERPHNGLRFPWKRNRR